jgi:peptidoglycan/xylan/chitin deacetylase (PgdA/CDA1 family)
MLVTFALWLALCTGGPTHAGTERWPQPALGPSYSGQPEILFTFDDGPHEKYTPRVLATLRAHHIKAIFFMVGWRLSGSQGGDTARRAVAAQIVAEGHAVGNHTVNHAHLCGVRATTAAWEIDENARIVADVAGMPASFFRAPYGSYCERLRALLKSRGLAHTHWDMDPQEWRTHDATATRNYLVRKLSKLEGRGVILLHDTHPATATALAEILEWIDKDNLRRRAEGKPEIRILSYADVARERVAPGLLELLDKAKGSALDLVPSVLGRLLPSRAHRLATPSPTSGTARN